MIESSTLQHEPVADSGRSFGRTARSVAGYALLLASMLISPLFVFVPAVIFHCGIRNGRLASVISVIGATLVAWLIAMQTAHVAGTTASDAMMSYAFLVALIVGIAWPALAVSRRVENGEPFGVVLLTAVFHSIVGLAFTEQLFRTVANFSPYQEQVVRAHQTAAQFVATYQKAGMPPDAVTMMRKWMDIGISCLPAFFIMDVVVIFILSLVMFGRLKAWRQFVTRREPAAKLPPSTYLFRNLSLPEWLLFAFVAGGLTPLASGMLQKVAANVLAVVTFLYLLQGLAIFRSLLVAVGAGFTGVMFGYLLLAFLTITGIAPLLLSIAGLFDSFFDFRKFKRKDHPDESHPH
jgi:hypothetical protein